ncbi:hypothetical protein ZOSMA_15G00870 [Zostera marina]|uniref:Protein ENHANCED DISEASE RESISTANCE 2 C-terminal domain-containing protein n=1 Tax=Zostera marina TaxID=29655 RepID=A0A0K9PUY4_ZOSMR|nr:hypothetical protein ZOSMA_15G00870 [Zostera marina]
MTSSDLNSSGKISSDEDTTYNWRKAAINGGSLPHVDLHTGTNGWASPPGDLFSLRSKNYFSTTKRRQKSPSGNWLLRPAGVDWIRSPTRLSNVLARSDNRIANALNRSKSQSQGHSTKSFIVAVNLQIPGRECHSAVFYFASDDEETLINPGSLLHRFIHGDDAFRNQRFKIVNRIVKGPWIVKAAVGNYAACLLGKALKCEYHRGENYLEIDVDIGSSAIANAILHLALGYVTAVTIDMGFVVEAQEDDELPEKLFGAVRVAQMEMSSATFIDSKDGTVGEDGVASIEGKGRVCGFGSSKVIDHQNSWKDRGTIAEINNSSNNVGTNKNKGKKSNRGEDRSEQEG